jgi:uncharacterized protein (DUF488 family)
MGTSDFAEALNDLVARVGDIPTALLCSEAVPWRCHRSLIADALTVRSFPVEHIMSEAQTKRHALTPFAHVEGEQITYPLPLISSSQQ